MPISTSIDELLDAVQTYTDNAYSQPEAKAAFESKSYGLAFLDEGKGLLETARTRIREYDREMGEQKEATASRDALLKALRPVYRDDRDAAEDAFAESETGRRALSLDETIPRGLTEWSEQAGRFYAALLVSPEYVAAMAEEGAEAEDLQEMQDSVAELKRLASEQVRELGEARLAAQAQRDALDALDGWYRLARRRARRLFRETPRMLDALGV
jgi:hypothetical protein